MNNDNVYGLPSTRYTLPAGAVVRVGPISGMNACSIKLLTGGTLEIGGFGPSLSLDYGFVNLGVSGTVAAGNTFGQAYPLTTNEIFSANLSGSVYMYASGATCVVAVAFGRSQGF